MTTPKSTFDQLTKPIKIGDLMQAISNGDGKPLVASHSIDCDDGEGQLNVMQTFDGDVHMSISPGRNQMHVTPGFRARTWDGGGRHERVRRALLLLALAMKEDVSL